MKELNLKIESLAGNTLTVLQGQALEQMPSSKISFSGDIKTVGNFLTKRMPQAFCGLQTVDPSKVIITVDKKKLEIQLFLDPENVYGASIRGVLEESEELKPFCINENHTFRKEELVKLLKFNKLFFDDADKHAELVLAFQKVSSTVNIRANESSDDRGNKERAFVKDVTTNAPTEFILSIPIFKGFPPKRFRVEICLDVTEGSARFWFESVELHELKQKMIEDIFTEELKVAQDFVIINK